MQYYNLLFLEVIKNNKIIIIMAVIEYTILGSLGILINFNNTLQLISNRTIIAAKIKDFFILTPL
ncbi:hypothetical protein V275_02757 [Staphylococcus aureus W65910]|nr:hypothetical protein V275_02757 [Staphylococcus aureus W65910]EYL27350.1 hypothetical protein V668_02743 [Staphylococcus aureus F38211]